MTGTTRFYKRPHLVIILDSDAEVTEIIERSRSQHKNILVQILTPNTAFTITKQTPATLRKTSPQYQ